MHQTFAERLTHEPVALHGDFSAPQAVASIASPGLNFMPHISADLLNHFAPLGEDLGKCAQELPEFCTQCICPNLT